VSQLTFVLVIPLLLFLTVPERSTLLLVQQHHEKLRFGTPSVGSFKCSFTELDLHLGWYRCPYPSCHRDQQYVQGLYEDNECIVFFYIYRTLNFALISSKWNNSFEALLNLISHTAIN